MDEYSRFLIKDLQQFGPQSNWDWRADHRFSARFGTEEEKEHCERLISFTGLEAFRIAYWEEHVRPTITKKRLRCLRKLVKSNRVYATWVGTGEGGFYEFGMTRIRSYGLVSSNDQGSD